MMDDKYIFKRAFIIEILQLHPALVWGMVVIDFLLFLAEIFTFGVSYFLSILISILFGIFTIYVQMMACGDDFVTAFSKGLLTTLIVLTPSSFLTILYLILYMSKKKEGVDEFKEK